MTRTVLNGHGKPVVLTRENCTINGHRWPTSEGCIQWGDMDWHGAMFLEESIWIALGYGPDPHLRVPHRDIPNNPMRGAAHHIRGRRWRITGLLQPMETAPLDRPIMLAAGGMLFRAVYECGFEGEAGEACCWVAVEEGRHPPCWDDGVCWAVNSELVPSTPPVGWCEVEGDR